MRVLPVGFSSISVCRRVLRPSYRRATRRFDPAPYELRTAAAVAPTAN